jgi:hypothetical protein
MTWLGQLWHLLKKDAAEHRWLALLYVLSVVLAMGHAIGWHPLESSTLGMMMVLVAIVGGMVTATAIQGDSPTQPDAFWASRPLDSSAVVSAKISTLVVVVGVATLAQLFVLHWFDLDWSDSRQLVTEPALGFAFGLLGSLLVGAVTRDLRTFILAIIAIPVSLILLGLLLDSLYPRTSLLKFSSSGLLATKLLIVVAELLLLAWLYYSRDNRLLVRIAGFALAGLTLFTLLASIPQPARTDTTVPGYVPRIAIRVEQREPRIPRNGTDLGFDLVMPPDPEGYRYAIDGAKAVVRLRDGSRMRMDLGLGFLEVSSGALQSPSSLPLLRGVRWLGSEARAERRIDLAAMLDADQRARLARGVDSVAIDARVRVLALVASDTLALAVGSELRDGGRVVRVEEWDPRNGDFLLTVQMKDVRGKSAMDATDWIGEVYARYALLNQQRGEAVSLPTWGNGFGVSGIVLPGSTMLSNTARYGSREPVPARPVLDAAWLRNAALVVVTPVPLGSYPLHLEASALPAPTSNEKTPGRR